jgi:hypothetical protein
MHKCIEMHAVSNALHAVAVGALLCRLARHTSALLCDYILT